MKNGLAVALWTFIAVSADHCKLVFDSRQLHSGATRTHTGTCGSVQSGKQTVLMRYRRAIARGVEMTAESQWVQGGCDSGGTKCCCIFLHQVEIRSLGMLPRTVKNLYALHRRYNLKYINKCQNNFGSWNVCLAVMVSVYHLWVSWYFACKVLKHDFCSKWRYTLRIGKAVLSVNVAFLFFI